MTNYNPSIESGTFVQKSRAGLVMSAIGATLAMLPLTLAYLISAFGGDLNGGIMTFTLILTTLGTLLWGIGMFMTIKPMSKVGGAWSAVLGGIVLMLILTFVLILFFLQDFINEVFRGISGGEALGVLVLIGFMATHILLAICCGKIGKFAKGLKLSKIGYWILAFTPVALGILFYLISKSYHNSWYGSWYSSDYETYLTLMKIVNILIGVGVLLCIIGWWISVGNGICVEYEYEDDGVVTTVGTATAPVVTPAVQAAAVLERPENQDSVITQHPVLSEDLKNGVMAMTNEQLQQIIANGSGYSPEYVVYVSTVLAKREAWEKLNAYTDQELMNIVADNQQNMDDRDAASMELFNRQSPLLLDVVKDLDAETLKNVVENPDDNFDGYVAVARQLLGMD